jgi:hypothetical protein
MRDYARAVLWPTPLRSSESAVELLEPYKTIADGARTAVAFLQRVISDETVAARDRMQAANMLLDAATRMKLDPPTVTYTD